MNNRRVCISKTLIDQLILGSRRLSCYLSVAIIILGSLVATFEYPISDVYASGAYKTTSVNKLNAIFTVVGNKVLMQNGQQYIPEGISVYGGLEDSNYNLNTGNIDAQIIASSKYWYANTVRLQVAEGNLFDDITPGKSYNDNFLQAILSQVNLAHSLGMAVVINDQTEFTSQIPGPTAVTSMFWKIMSQTFRNKPYVIFDLFNEPRLEKLVKALNSRSLLNAGVQQLRVFGLVHSKISNPKFTPVSIWNLWKSGGKLNGVSYFGMQNLVNQIRGYQANNLIWIEGPNQAQELPTKNYLIKGANIEYSIHHPNLNSSESWAPIGNLSEIAPVVDGEWAQYQSPWAECFSRAYSNAPLYLKYLKVHEIGIIAWSLQVGSLVQGGPNTIPSNLNNPNSPISPEDLKIPSTLFPSYDCGYEFGQGVGQLLQTYFSKNSTKYIL